MLDFIAQLNPADVVAFPINQADKISDLYSKAWDGTWDIALGTTLYKVVTNVGTACAIFTLLFWLANFMKDLLDDGTSKKAWTELIYPVIVAYLLSNGGSHLATMTKGLRSIVNTINQEVLVAVSTGNSVQNDFKQKLAEIADYSSAEQRIIALREECNSKTSNQEMITCLQGAKVAADAVIAEYRKNKPPGSSWLDKLGKQVQTTINDPMSALGNTASAAVDAYKGMISGVYKIASTPTLLVIQMFILAFQGAFQSLIEVSMLLTALMGPIAVGTSLLPIGAKPVYAWLTGFLSLGMCKISLNIITGLVATAFYDAGPIDTLRISICIGILSPILALGLSTGGGMAIFNGILSAASSAASMGVNIGVRLR